VEITVSFTEALAVAVAALKARGASSAHAQATGRALVTAEAEGNRAVGLKHLFTYGEALADGRAKGDAERAAKVYEGFAPLAPQDVAAAILWAVTRPPSEAP